MAYKIPVTKDDFIKINESEQSEKNKQTEKSEQLKEKVDYYLDILKKEKLNVLKIQVTILLILL